jgi:hypothetical protein
MQMLKLSQMLKLLARNMTFSFQKQALKMRYSPYVNKGFVYMSVSKILNFIPQLFIFSWF